MWDNAPLLRSIANALLYFCALVVLYDVAYYVLHAEKLLPIRSVRLVAVPGRVVPDDVRAMVQREVRGNFLTVDIDKLRQSLATVPWVRQVSIRREFPDGLAVAFDEHQPLARWNDAALVNLQGEVFVAETKEDLPLFEGVDGSSAEVAREYALFNRQLAALNLRVTQLALSPRHAWQLRLSNDMVVELGRELMQQRLKRFVSVYPYSLGSPTHATGLSAKELQVFDMRYRNGFAVRMRRKNA
ncbi:MAG: cell division protein FtsQ/DivIB [Gallionella sp.]|nr:cell division protein FtsQ/DivIB [Gallionella sp.]